MNRQSLNAVAYILQYVKMINHRTLFRSKFSTEFHTVHTHTRKREENDVESLGRSRACYRVISHST
jgi:hypothetical protein